MIKNYLHHKLFFLLLCNSVLLSCSTAQIDKYTKIKKPDIQFHKYQVVSVSSKRVKLNLLFNARNPNDIAIDSFFMNYELFVNNKSFIKGLKAKLKLIPKGNSIISLPINITYKKLLSSFSSVASLVIKGKNNLPMVADIEIFGQFKVVNLIKHDFRYRKKINMKVPLPKYAMKDAMQFIQGVR